MTRAEIEKIRAVAPYCFETDGEKTWYEIGYSDGLKVVDVELLLKSLWHDAGEEPEDNSHILIRYKYLGTMEFKSYHLNYQCDFTWSELVDFLGIEDWAYVDDIKKEFPKGGKK